MRMLPRIFGDNFFDDFMDHPFERYLPMLRGSDVPVAMKADLVEKGGNYELSMELPGVKKEDIEICLKDGYILISASTDSESDEEDDDKNYIKRERYTGEYRRSFFVGDGVSQKDIKAKFENGVLFVVFPKKEPKDDKSSKIIAVE